MTNYAPKPDIIAEARRLAADGLGVEDLMVRLGIPRPTARVIVFGKKRP
jgi:hypothetical protein